MTDYDGLGSFNRLRAGSGYRPMLVGGRVEFHYIQAKIRVRIRIWYGSLLEVSLSIAFVFLRHPITDDVRIYHALG